MATNTDNVPPAVGPVLSPSGSSLVRSAWAWPASITAAIAVLAVAILPKRVPGADLPFHLADATEIAAALQAGDAHFWLSDFAGGHPAGLTYPLLPGMLLALLHLAGLGLDEALRGLAVVALAAPALVWCVALRGVVSPGRAAVIAVCIACITSTSPWGMGPAVLLYAGLLPQTVGALMLPLVIVVGIRAVRSGNVVAAGIVALIAAATHPVITALAAVPVALVVADLARNPTSRTLALKNASRLGAAVFCCAVPLLLPGLVATLSWGGVAHRAVGDAGDADVVVLLLHGLLLDYGRLPLLTVGAGLVVVAAVIPRTRRCFSPTTWLGVGCAGIGVVVVSLGAATGGSIPFGRALILVQAGSAVAVGSAVVDAAAAVSHRARIALFVGAVIAGLALTSSTLTHTANLALLPPIPKPVVDKAVADIAALATKHTPPARVAADGPVPAAVLGRAFQTRGVPALFVEGGPSFHGAPWRRILDDSDADLDGWRYVGGRVRWQDGRGVVEAADPGEFCAVVNVDAADAAVGADDDAGWTTAVQQWRAGPRTRGLLRGAALGLSTAASAQVRTVEQKPSRVDIDVDVADGPALLMCKFGMHPWWRATVDGVAVDVHTVAPLSPAVVVPPGAHHVSLAFVRPLWTWLLWLSPFALLLSRRSRV